MHTVLVRDQLRTIGQQYSAQTIQLALPESIAVDNAGKPLVKTDPSDFFSLIDMNVRWQVIVWVHDHHKSELVANLRKQFGGQVMFALFKVRLLVESDGWKVSEAGWPPRSVLITLHQRAPLPPFNFSCPARAP